MPETQFARRLIVCLNAGGVLLVNGATMLAMHGGLQVQSRSSVRFNVLQIPQMRVSPDLFCLPRCFLYASIKSPLQSNVEDSAGAGPRQPQPDEFDLVLAPVWSHRRAAPAQMLCSGI